MSPASPRFAIALALLLAAGCAGSPSQPATGASPTPSDGAVPEPSLPAPASAAPTAPPSAAPTASVTTDGRVTLVDVPAGQRAEAVPATGSVLLLAVSSASDQAIDLPVSVTPGKATTDLRQARLAPELAASHALMSAPAAPSGIRHTLQAKTREVGSTDTFEVIANGATYHQTATLRRVTDHAYFYVDKAAVPVSDDKLNDFISTFESTIYPRVTAAFGAEAKPGIDGDSKLFIVFSPAVHDFARDIDTYGYFWLLDATPGAGHNDKEVLFVSDVSFTRAPTLGKVTLAHELEHLINYTRKGPLLNWATNEAPWLDEGMAMLSMEVAGYGLAQNEQLIATGIEAFEDAPGDYTLQDWGANPNGRAFGQSYLFVRYLADRYGTGVLKELIDSPKRGQDVVEEVLAKRGDHFVPFFRAWAIANMLNDNAASAGTIYRYQNLKLTGTFGDTTLSGFHVDRPTGNDFKASLKPWSTRYYRFEAAPGTTWRVTVGGGAAGRAVAGVVTLP